jgi:putative transposase
MRNLTFTSGQHYHVCNRGTDKREIFTDLKDLNRFFETMMEFNTVETVGGIYQKSFLNKIGAEKNERKPLVKFVAYCLNPNHFHFLLEQMEEKGVEKFMHRLGVGYTKYYNSKYKRNGVLFQGKFKAKHVDSNEYLLHLSAYINGNNQLRNPVSKLSKSSFEEYLNPQKSKNFCDTDIVLGQFSNPDAYRKFLEGSVEDISYRKALEEEFS